MPEKRGTDGKFVKGTSKTGGRRPGSRNKTSESARSQILAVYEQLGGAAFMRTWAEQNPSDFFRLFGRLLPRETLISTPELRPLVIDTIRGDELQALRAEQPARTPDDDDEPAASLAASCEADVPLPLEGDSQPLSGVTPLPGWRRK